MFFFIKETKQNNRLQLNIIQIQKIYFEDSSTYVVQLYFIFYFCVKNNMNNT